MVDHKYGALYTKPHVDKQIRITAADGSITLTNEDIHWEEFELTESLCSDSELRFGACEAGMLKFRISNVFLPLTGKWLTVTETLDGHEDAPFSFGRYKVCSDVPTADRRYRDVTAYDAMYDILNADVAAWYNSVLPNKDSAATLRQFRESFIRHFDLKEAVPEGGLVNDGITVERTIEPEQLSGKDVITAICEINGCFGHIGRDGAFHFVYLIQDIQGLYPANDLYPDHAPEFLSQAQTGHLYPQDPKTTRLGSGSYLTCQYEDYIVRTINRLQIRQEENDVGAVCGNGDNSYVVEDNFLVYGKEAAELALLAERLYEKIRGIIYRPFSAECVGNPCLEVGDPVRLLTRYEIVESYIFKRTLKGIQGLRDTYGAEGTEKRSEQVNSIQHSLVQLKGKTNTLDRSIEETRSELKDTEENLRSTIRQTASEIRTEVENADQALSSRITQNAESITSEIDRASGAEGKLSTRITQNAESIASEVSRASEEEGKLSSRITQNAESITSEVSRAAGAEGNLSARITQNADKIEMKVSKGSVSSEITQEAGKIHISSDRLSISSTNFSLEENGTVTAKNGSFSGNVTATSGSFSGNVNASSGSFNSVTIKGATITSSSISGNAGSISGGTYSNSKINGGTLSGGTGGSYVGSCNGSNLESCSTNGTTLSLAGNGVLTSRNGNLEVAGDGGIVYIKAGNSYHVFHGSNFSIPGDFVCEGAKHRAIRTRSFGKRKLDAFETPMATFSDYGKGTLDENGTCCLVIDPVFAQTVGEDYMPIVFLTKYGQGDVWMDEEHSTHDTIFVCGTPGLAFSWETRYQQANCFKERLLQLGYEEPAAVSMDYDLEANVEYKRTAADYERTAAEYLELAVVNYGNSGCDYFEEYEREVIA
ncbi:MAG: hypothetical protein HFI93_05710 [Lachnospiraceae bacterium]|nr:hypothetical protein [Lachnospiraceae bacterium]